MNTIRYILLFVLAPGGLSTGLPQEPASIVAREAESEHPFYRSGGLPEWSKLTPQQALLDAQHAARLARGRVQEILRISPQEANFENVFLAAEEAKDELRCVMLLMQHLAYVSDSAENRAALEKITALVADCVAEIFSNEQLWHLMQVAATPEKTARLSPAQQRAVKQLIDIFIDNGAELSAEDKKKKNELEKEMLLLGMQYEKNSQDFSQSWELLITDESELAGLPPEVKQMLAQAAAAAGKKGWLVTMRDDSVSAVMALCHVEQTRKKCWEALCGNGAGTPYDNAPLIAELMEKRQAFAELLGFGNYADYAARTRMVQHGEEALAFVDDLIAKLKPAYDEQCRKMLNAYNSYFSSNVTQLQPWDELQLLSIYCSMQTSVSTAAISSYFKYTDVLNGLFGVYSELLGISFKQLPTVCLKPGETCPPGKVEVWHPEVKCVALYDTQSGTHLGTFYLDLFRRDNKRDGAWCAPLRLATPGPGGAVQEPHIVALMANFPPRRKGVPTLLKHEEVVVLFHEFGHILHHVLSHTEIRGHCALGVAWDFCEFPSTLSENWAWSPEVLATFARHYKTRKPCPPAVLQELAKNRSMIHAVTYMETLCKAKLDLELHLHYKEKFRGRPLDDVSAALVQECRLPFASVPFSPLRNLPHCFSGWYAAGVYSYLWSEVMAADAFTRFAEQGLLNPEIGKKYREIILEKGDSMPADELYRLFMGRNPESDAFLEVHKLNR